MTAVTILVGGRYPLEVAVALVEAAVTQDHWFLQLSASAYRVVKESAFVAVSALMERERLLVMDVDFSIGIRLLVNEACCELRVNDADPFGECLRFLQYCGAPTAEVANFNMRRAARWQAAAGQSSKAAILIGTGPSLRDLDLRPYRGALTIGCNKLYLLPYAFIPTHYVFEDRVVTEDVFAQRPNLGGAMIWLPHDLGHLAETGIRYCLDRVVLEYPSFSTTPDLAFSGWTVMYVMLQIAYWMSVKEVYLVGVDGTYREPPHLDHGIVRTSVGPDHAHFTADYYGPGTRYQRPEPERVTLAYDAAQRAYRDGGCRIVNCSKRSVIESFERGTLPPPEYFRD